MDEVPVDALTGTEVGAPTSIARNVLSSVPVRMPAGPLIANVHISLRYGASARRVGSSSVFL